MMLNFFVKTLTCEGVNQYLNSLPKLEQLFTSSNKLAKLNWLWSQQIEHWNNLKKLLD